MPLVIFAVLLVAMVCWLIATYWWVVALLAFMVAVPWLMIRKADAIGSAFDRMDAHAREIWRVQVKVRRDARVKRVRELKYPTYIKRWTPERRAAEAKAHAAYDRLFRAMVHEVEWSQLHTLRKDAPVVLGSD